MQVEGMSIEIPVKRNAWVFALTFIRAWVSGDEFVRIRIDKANIVVNNVSIAENTGEKL